MGKLEFSGWLLLAAEIRRKADLPAQMRVLRGTHGFYLLKVSVGLSTDD